MLVLLAAPAKNAMVLTSVFPHSITLDDEDENKEEKENEIENECDAEDELIHSKNHHFSLFCDFDFKVNIPTFNHSLNDSYFVEIAIPPPDLK